MKDENISQISGSPQSIPRRSFLRRAAFGAAALAPGVSLMGSASKALSSGGGISAGDAALLQFAAAAEIIETDLWVQYNELAGIPIHGDGSGNPTYAAALAMLDDDMAQYIHDNTQDEFTHQNFLNAYLASKGAATVDFGKFRTLPGSTATGSSRKPRVTNLMQLTVDTSWWTRYRSPTFNPDLNPNFVFPQAVPDLFHGQFTAIPRTDADLTPADHIQAIANTAGFHFGTIEQGGTSLYPAMAQRASDPEVLRILLSIGPTESMHFQTWSDTAGDAPPLTDPTNGLTFPDLNSPPFGGEIYSTNLIMPEPCNFLSTSLPTCSIVRPTETEGIAMNVVEFLTAMGLFIGQSSAFFTELQSLAAAADAAQRQ